MSSKQRKTYYVKVDGPIHIGGALLRKNDPVDLTEGEFEINSAWVTARKPKPVKKEAQG